MKNIFFTTKLNEEQCNLLASKLMPLLKQGDIIHLVGELGAGKSTLARAIIRAASNNSELTVPSPTFTLLQSYNTNIGDIWHYDLYRISIVDEIYELGFEEGLETAISLIEWPERLGGLTDNIALKIELQHGDNIHYRKIIFSSQSQKWQDRLSNFLTSIFNK